MLERATTNKEVVKACVYDAVARRRLGEKLKILLSKKASRLLEIPPEISKLVWKPFMAGPMRQTFALYPIRRGRASFATDA